MANGYKTFTKEFDKKENGINNEFSNKIINGNSLEILKKLPDNFDMGYDQHQDNMDWDEYFTTLKNVFEECIRVTKFGGRIAINIQPFFSEYIPSHHILTNFFLEKGLIWKTEILWEKSLQ